MKNHQRDPGVDLLRLFAMGLIVLHHLLSHGGLLFAFPAFSPSAMGVHLLNAFTRCAVNAYALISGYVLVNGRFRPARLMGLWLQTAFWGVMAALFFALDGAQVTAADWLDALFPITRNTYWYFTCYAGVFVLSPFLNALLKALNRRQAALLAGAVTLLFSVLPAFAMKDVFQLGGGYHAGWLVILYLLGGCMRLHGFGWLANRKRAAVAFMLGAALAWAFRLAAVALDAPVNSELLLDYTAPTMLLCAAALLAFSRGLALPGWLAKAATALSPLTFGVYLIHDNPLVRKHLISMRLTALANGSPIAMLLGLFICWAGLYAACLVLEWLRLKLFERLRVPALCARCETLLLRRFSAPDA